MAGSHSITVLSFDAEARSWPSGLNATALAQSELPSRILCNAPEANGGSGAGETYEFDRCHRALYYSVEDDPSSCGMHTGHLMEYNFAPHDSPLPSQEYPDAEGCIYPSSVYLIKDEDSSRTDPCVLPPQRPGTGGPSIGPC